MGTGPSVEVRSASERRELHQKEIGKEKKKVIRLIENLLDCHASEKPFDEILEIQTVLLNSTLSDDEILALVKNTYEPRGYVISAEFRRKKMILVIDYKLRKCRCCSKKMLEQ